MGSEAIQALVHRDDRTYTYSLLPFAP